MRMRSVILPLFLTTVVFAQTADTGTAHKAAATALLNSNNAGAARLACPATIGPVSTANSPAGPARAGGPPLVLLRQKGGLARPQRKIAGMPKGGRYSTISTC